MNPDTVLIPITLSTLKCLITESVNDAFKKENAKAPYSEYPELLTRQQVSEILNVCLATIDSWTRQGKLIKHRIDSTVRYKKSEILVALKTYQKFQRG